MILLTIREFEQREIDLDPLLDSSRLNVREDVQKFFEFRFHNRRLIIQPQGCVGLVPLNSSLAIDIQPRVDIDLARILQLSGTSPEILQDIIRKYSTRGDLIPSMLRLYAESLERAILEIVEHGVMRRYERVEARTSSPLGRVMVDQTIRRTIATGQAHMAVTSRFEKRRNTELDDLLLAALQSLDAAYEESRSVLSAVDRTAISRSLNHCALRLAFNWPVSRRQPRERDWADLGSAILPHHAYYRAAVAISRAIVKGSGVAIDSTTGLLEMKASVIDTAAAFEAYLRNILRRAAIGHSAEVDVVDGNLDPRSGGGMRYLFDAGQQRKVTPDIVLRNSHDSSASPLVVDAKYKPIRSGLDRADLNQMLVYGLVYRSPRVVVVHPVHGGQPSGLNELGTTRGITVFRYGIDLSQNEIRKQEFIAADRILRLSRE